MKDQIWPGKESDELKESDYTDELPKEMLDRIKNAKEDAGVSGNIMNPGL